MFKQLVGLFAGGATHQLEVILLILLLLQHWNAQDFGDLTVLKVISRSIESNKRTLWWWIDPSAAI